MQLSKLIGLCTSLVVLMSTPAHGQPAGKPIYVGQLASVTNPISSGNAKEFISGIELAFERVNRAGGIKGRPLKLVTKDDQFDANKSVGLTTELVAESDIVAMVGNFGTPSLMKLAAEGTLEKLQMASIGPVTGLQSALDKPNMFAVRGSYEDEVLAMLNHATRIGRARIAYLYFEAGVGIQLAKLAPDMAKAAGVQLVDIQGFPITPERALQEAAVTKSLATLGDKSFDAMVLIAVGVAHSEAVKAVRKRYGKGMPIYSLGQVNPATLVKDVGTDLAAGVMLTQVMPSPGSRAMAIVRDYQADRLAYQPANVPSYMALEGYITASIAGELIKRAKAVDRPSVLASASGAGQLNVRDFAVSYGATKRKSLNTIEITMVNSYGKLIR